MASKQTTRITALRGMKDIYPPESFFWNSIECDLRAVFKLFGFSEIRTPLLEQEELFKRSIGQATDIVQKEMYQLTDRKGRSLVMRPEATASIARAYVEHKCYSDQSVVKWFYIGPMFRAERPQAGRQRQFHQAGVELIGADSPACDAEVIMLAAACLEAVGVKEFSLKINTLGCADDRLTLAASLREHLEPHKNALCADCRDRYDRNVLRVLDCKNPACKKIITHVPPLQEGICSVCRDHFDAVCAFLTQSAIPFTIDHQLVRGLDYYSRTVFEITSGGLGSQDAILAGGRYDGLITALGGPAVGATGFAMGLERLIIACGAADRQTAVAPADVSITIVDSTALSAAVQLSHMLRRQGIATLMTYGDKSLKAQMRSANKKGTPFVIIIARQAYEAGMVTIKHMPTGKQQDCSLTALPGIITAGEEGFDQ